MVSAADVGQPSAVIPAVEPGKDVFAAEENEAPMPVSEVIERNDPQSEPDQDNVPEPDEDRLPEPDEDRLPDPDEDNVEGQEDDNIQDMEEDNNNDDVNLD